MFFTNKTEVFDCYPWNNKSDTWHYSSSSLYSTQYIIITAPSDSFSIICLHATLSVLSNCICSRPPPCLGRVPRDPGEVANFSYLSQMRSELFVYKLLPRGPFKPDHWHHTLGMLGSHIPTPDFCPYTPQSTRSWSPGLSL